MIDNENFLYLDTSQFKLKHVARGWFDKNSRKQLRTGFHLINSETLSLVIECNTFNIIYFR